MRIPWLLVPVTKIHMHSILLGGPIATVKLDHPRDRSLSEGMENGNAFQLLKALTIAQSDDS